MASEAFGVETNGRQMSASQYFCRTTNTENKIKIAYSIFTMNSASESHICRHILAAAMLCSVPQAAVQLCLFRVQRCSCSIPHLNTGVSWCFTPSQPLRLYQSDEHWTYPGYMQ